MIDMLSVLRQIADTLISDKNDTYLSDYIENLSNEELKNFTVWFSCSICDIEDIDDINDLDYDDILDKIRAYKPYLKIANFLSTSPIEDEPIEGKEDTRCVEEPVVLTPVDPDAIKKAKGSFSIEISNTLGYVCVLSVFAYIFGVTFFMGSIDESHLRFVDQSLGNLYAILNTVIGFYFGGMYKASQTHSH